MASGVPSPAAAPELWDTIGLGTLPRFPPVYPGGGGVKVVVKTAAKVDQQTANGKDGARSKTTGRAVAKGTMTFAFIADLWNEGNALREAIDPGGDGYGLTWEVSYPELAARKVNRVLFHDMGDLVITGDSYSFSVEFDGWDEPKKALQGGTKTPTKPVQHQEGITASIGSNGNIVNFGDPPVTVLGEDGKKKFGFDGPSAPDARVPTS
jgi:hypothetical protein